MLYVRALIFTVLVPGFVTGWAPRMLLGIALAITGVAGYLLCAADFLLKGGGTPAIWFTRRLRFLLREEPRVIVEQGLYRYSRNPMYVSVAGANYEDYCRKTPRWIGF